MTKEQQTMLRCMMANLISGVKAIDNRDLNDHDWESQRKTICEALEYFPELQEEFGDFIEDDES